MADDAATYGAAEVCFAADVPRPRFNAWVARQFIAPGPGPGMGIARRFTLLEAIRISVMAELGRLGAPAGMAAGYAGYVTGDYAKVPTVMILGRRQKGLPSMDIVPVSKVADLVKLLAKMQCMTIVDLTGVATTTKRILQDPMTKHRATMRTKGGWDGATGEKVFVEVHDPSAQDVPARPPARKRGRVVEPA